MEKRTWLKLSCVFFKTLLCILLILTISLGLAACTEGQPQNPDSSGADGDLSYYEPAVITEVDTVDWDASHKVSAKIDYVGEDEVWSDSNLSFFRGTVQSVKTLTTDLGTRQIGDRILTDGLRYYAVLTIRVAEVYRGDFQPGDEISACLTVVGSLGYFDYVRSAYESMISGTEGIFGVSPDEDGYDHSDERIVYHSSLADYSVSFFMLDTERPVSFRFLAETQYFPDLDGGETYIRNKLAPYLS